MTDTLLPCPFCGNAPDLPSGVGTQYEIECNGCGQTIVSVQICDLMTIEERVEYPFTEYRYAAQFVERAKKEAIDKWNTRAPAQPAQVQGWQMVPVKITPAMENADPYGMGYGRLHAIWSSLLAAAPKPPVQECEAPSCGCADAYCKAWDEAPQPSDDVAKDAARWDMLVKIYDHVLTHPDSRKHDAEYGRYKAAIEAGLGITGAIDAAMAGGGE